MKLARQPVAYSAAVKAVLGALVLLGVVHLTGVQVTGIVLAVDSVLGVFVWSSVTPNATVTEKVDAAEKAKTNEVIAYLSGPAVRQPTPAAWGDAVGDSLSAEQKRLARNAAARERRAAKKKAGK